MRKRGACSVEGCGVPHWSNGYCSRHYQQVRRTGRAVLTKKKSLCSMVGCNRTHISKGYCAGHYQRRKRTGDPGPADLSRKITQGCVIVGCENIHYGRGYCSLHYARWKKYGNATKSKIRDYYMSSEAVIDWMLEQSIRTEDGCFEFRKSLDKDGYGTTTSEGKKYRANRLMLGFLKGRELQREELALHTCHNPSCIHPEHLYLGTPKENTRDMFDSHRTPNIGATHHQSKLNPKKVWLIRKYRDQLSTKFMARSLNVSTTTILNVLRGDVWTHV